MKHVVMSSGGIGSWATAQRVKEMHGRDDLVLLFADTKIEDPDLYRFLEETVRDLDPAEFIRVSVGKTPWDVFYEQRFLGNSRIDPCSKFLKRVPLRKYIEGRFDPAETVVYLGMDFMEAHRFEKAKGYWAPWTVAAPLLDPPYLDKQGQIDALGERGIEPPRLYAMGFAHNNCGGFCVKAGQGHFKRLLNELPEVYAEHEKNEKAFQDFIGKPVTILREQKDGVRGPLPLTVLRQRVEGGGDVDEFDIGGCNCFAQEDDGEWTS